MFSLARLSYSSYNIRTLSLLASRLASNSFIIALLLYILYYRILKFLIKIRSRELVPLYCPPSALLSLRQILGLPP